MRQQNQLLHTRTRVKPRYAVMPLEGYPPSKLPLWPTAEAFILASPALGAGFAEYLLNLQPGQGTTQEADGRTETFLFLLSGAADIALNGRQTQRLTSGGFAFLPHTHSFRFDATETAQVIVLRKAFEPGGGLPDPAPVVGNESDVPGNVYMGIEGSRLKVLIPDDMAYDMAMNIFTFEPGYSLPVVETHVMEHGLYFLQGKGVYYLDQDWMEVEAGDFIWMGPYCPQSYYATGPVASRYLYYKNVNRDVTL